MEELLDELLDELLEEELLEDELLLDEELLLEERPEDELLEELLEDELLELTSPPPQPTIEADSRVIPRAKRVFCIIIPPRFECGD